jgi:hypothetical protein
MNKETVTTKLQEALVGRAVRKIEAGTEDFPAYPLIGSFVVGLLVGIGNDSDSFYNKVNQSIVDKVPSQVYAISRDHSNGFSDGRNRVRANLRPIRPNDMNDKVKIRAYSPRTQTE